MTRVTFYGHACFTLEDAETSLIFDPFLNDNPVSPIKSEQVKADYILLTHWHMDHLGDTFKIAKARNSLVISTFELATVCESRKIRAHSMHLGGKHKFDFGFVRITPAFHGSGIPGGHACGFIVKFNNHIIYHSGDTSLFGDMKLLGELEKIELALLPIGDNFTMGISDAVRAVEMIKPEVVIPMHYNTWPLIECDPKEFKEEVEKRTQTKCVILAPGESYTM
ncbi:MAG: metal-dependent hydrolase [Firmicutes bacterium HGW-Firmicutes-13]|nr:MAG: metal-dependent hydrolase [Firmicutes bacterium HGW-Firmicutes-13]